MTPPGRHQLLEPAQILDCEVASVVISSRSEFEQLVPDLGGHAAARILKLDPDPLPVKFDQHIQLDARTDSNALFEPDAGARMRGLDFPGEGVLEVGLAVKEGLSLGASASMAPCTNCVCPTPFLIRSAPEDGGRIAVDLVQEIP